MFGDAGEDDMIGGSSAGNGLIGSNPSSTVVGQANPRGCS